MVMYAVNAFDVYVSAGHVGEIPEPVQITAVRRVKHVGHPG